MLLIKKTDKIPDDFFLFEIAEIKKSKGFAKIDQKKY